MTSRGEIQQVVTKAAGRIEELGQLGDRIGAVVETIDDIAELTNRLALNAAIQAAPLVVERRASHDWAPSQPQT